jgi:hypothetical protein
VVGAEPAAQRVGNRLVWTLEPLPPGREKQLHVELQPQRAGELAGDTIVNMILSTRTRTLVVGDSSRPVNPAPAQGVLSLSVLSPGMVRVDQSANFEVEVINRGREKLKGLILTAYLPSGLEHPLGAQLEATVGDLEPNVKRSFTVPTTAKKAGKQVIQVRMTAQNGQEAEGVGEVLVTTQGVQVRQAPATHVVLHRDGDISLEVTNHEPTELHNVTVTNQLPQGVEFIAASDRGIYRPESRTVYWLLERLPAGQTKNLAVKVQGSKSGQYVNETIVRAKHLGEQHSTSQLQVEGLTDLVVKIAKRDDALEVGRDTVYEIRLVNQGTTPATNVRLHLSLTEGLTPQLAQGPTAGKAQGQTVVFGAVPSLAAGGQAVFHLQAHGESVGDRRLRAHVSSDQLRQPLNKEDRIVVYQEK